MFALEDVESIKKELTDEECSLHPLGAQEPFYFLCYRVLKENCDGDVVYLIFSLLLSMRLSRDKYGFLLHSHSVFLPVQSGNDVCTEFVFRAWEQHLLCWLLIHS